MPAGPCWGQIVPDAANGASLCAYLRVNFLA
jgi:hypothetical protein